MSEPRVTIEMLLRDEVRRNKGHRRGYRPHLAIFRLCWPQGAVVTLENIRKAQEFMLDLECFVSGFLTQQAQDAYEKAMRAASRAYLKASHLYWEALEWSEHTGAPIPENLDEAEIVAWETLEEAKAQALFNALMLDKQSKCGPIFGKPEADDE